MKSRWTKPELIVIARGTPEESVLLHCKRIAAPWAASPLAVGQAGCDKAELDGNCGACQARAST